MIEVNELNLRDNYVALLLIMLLMVSAILFTVVMIKKEIKNNEKI